MSRNVSETENVTVFVGTPKTEVQATLVIDGFPEELAMKPHEAFMSDDFLADGAGGWKDQAEDQPGHVEGDMNLGNTVHRRTDEFYSALACRLLASRWRALLRLTLRPNSVLFRVHLRCKLCNHVLSDPSSRRTLRIVGV